MTPPFTKHSTQTLPLLLASLSVSAPPLQGSSSPLGLLFDHGCDAVNTCMSSLTLCCTLQTGASVKTGLLLAATSTAFFAATWEEYYTGELVLPPINGPNEGVLLSCLFHSIAFFGGPAIWLTEISIVRPY